MLYEPAAYDALSAKIIKLIGFKTILHTGYGTAASLLGMPDIGLVSFKEMVERVKSIARAVKIPVIGDTGYENPINVYRRSAFGLVQQGYSLRIKFGQRDVIILIICSVSRS